MIAMTKRKYELLEFGEFGCFFLLDCFEIKDCMLMCVCCVVLMMFLFIWCDEV